MALQRLHGMSNENFMVFHANEIDEQSVARLERLQGVHVLNLEIWYTQTYPEHSIEGLDNFKGYFCKVGALLAAPFETVAVIDLDAVLLDNPFSLLRTPIYQNTGVYLFSDRRLPHSEPYKEHLTRMWAKFNPDRPDNISSSLTSSPPFTGWSRDYGESALVIFNKKRNFRAVEILEKMVAPDVFSATSHMVYGDKETYWRALALADAEMIGMNPYMWAAAGFPDGNGLTCCHKGALAQWVWLPGERPKVFYINGGGIEEWITGKDDVALSTVSDPVSYLSSRTQLQSFCSPGQTPFSFGIVQILHAYRLIFNGHGELSTHQDGAVSVEEGGRLLDKKEIHVKGNHTT
jgi:hypothetical protein